uniref:Otogelin n=1 Tax=Talaromyces marneffei PM1 TaxID=1077442 RepID=A0A093X712_TALMA
MKFTTALTVFLAFGPATVLAAPLTQDATSALTGGPAPGGPGEGAKAPAGPPMGGSSSQGMSGSSMGNEGLLDKVEKILKDVLGSLRKRGLVEEVGDVLEKALQNASKLLNGESSGSESSFSTQSTDPDALPPTAPQDGKRDDDKEAQPAPPRAPVPASAPVPAPAPAPAPELAPAPKKGSAFTSGSELSKLLGGRALLDEIDPVNTSGTTAPISNDPIEPTEANKLPAKPSAPAPIAKESSPVDVAPVDTKKQKIEDKKEKEGPNEGTPTGGFSITPEDLEKLKMFIASQDKAKSVPSMTDA